MLHTIHIIYTMLRENLINSFHTEMVIVINKFIKNALEFR